MNTKRFFAAIFAAAILSISFLACDPKEDDPTTNPTPTFDLVKEVYGFYGKPYTQVTAELDKKGWTKRVDTLGDLTVYVYYNSDSTKKYLLNLFSDTVKYIEYVEFESPEFSQNKLASSANKFHALFEKWELSINKIFHSEAQYMGIILADNFEYYQQHLVREEFLADYQYKKSTLNIGDCEFIYEGMVGGLRNTIDYEGKTSEIVFGFYSQDLYQKISKTSKLRLLLKP